MTKDTTTKEPPTRLVYRQRDRQKFKMNAAVASLAFKALKESVHEDNPSTQVILSK